MFGKFDVDLSNVIRVPVVDLQQLVEPGTVFSWKSFNGPEIVYCTSIVAWSSPAKLFVYKSSINGDMLTGFFNVSEISDHYEEFTILKGAKATLTFIG